MNDAEKNWPPKENWIYDGNKMPGRGGVLMGDRKGLETLKAAIEEALSKEGEVNIGELRGSWERLCLSEEHPEKDRDKPNVSTQGRAGGVLVLVVLGVIILMLLYGWSHGWKEVLHFLNERG